MKVKSEAQFFLRYISYPAGFAPKMPRAEPPAGEALKKARTTEIPQDSCCPSLGWVKSAPIRAVGGNDGTYRTGLDLSLAQRVLRLPLIIFRSPANKSLTS